MDKALGTRIRALRKANNMSITVLAEKIGKSHSYLSLLERGLAGYTDTTLRKISDIFQIDEALLLMDNVDVGVLAEVSEIVVGISNLPKSKQRLVMDSIKMILEAAAPTSPGDAT